MILLRTLSVPAFKHLRDVELAFPRAGSVLIEGPNESGKSTLFEAIYFALYGASLSNLSKQAGTSTERRAENQAAPSLAGLIPHNATVASVGLTLHTDGSELEIHRTLTRQQTGAADAATAATATVAQEARLVVRRPRARLEEVTGELAVNERILSALHGLDGEALRNSCFVEQRALDRVEALSRAAREEAIAKLLGLERLVGIERDLTPSAQDHAQVERARIEVSVAERSRAALEAQTREAQASVALRGARARAVVAQRESLAQQHGEHERQGQAMRDRSSELEGRIARAGQVAALLATLDAMEQDLSAGRESEATAAQLRATLADLDRIEREQLPAGQARVAELRDLEARLAAADRRGPICNTRNNSNGWRSWTSDWASSTRSSPRSTSTRPRSARWRSPATRAGSRATTRTRARPSRGMMRRSRRRRWMRATRRRRWTAPICAISWPTGCASKRSRSSGAASTRSRRSRCSATNWR